MAKCIADWNSAGLDKMITNTLVVISAINTCICKSSRRASRELTIQNKHRWKMNSSSKSTCTTSTASPSIFTSSCSIHSGASAQSRSTIPTQRPNVSFKSSIRHTTSKRTPPQRRNTPHENLGAHSTCTFARQVRLHTYICIGSSK